MTNIVDFIYSTNVILYNKSKSFFKELTLYFLLFLVNIY